MKQGLPRGTVPDRQPTGKLRKCASLPHFSIKAAHMPVLGYQRLIEAFFLILIMIYVGAAVSGNFCWHSP